MAVKRDIEKGEDFIAEALKRKKESRSVEYKERFNPADAGEWCEIIKDIVAIANSGGGIIVFGVRDDGTISSTDSSTIRQLDSATVADKLKKYTGDYAPDVEIVVAVHAGNFLVGFHVLPVPSPVVFMKPGTYSITEKEQACAFRQSTTYFRHGAKSEPGNSRDFQSFYDRLLKSERLAWNENVRKVVTAPKGARIQVVDKIHQASTQQGPILVQVSNDPSAQKVAAFSFDQSHPYRMTELVKKVNERLSPKLVVTNHDLFCVRRLYKPESNQNFYFKPMHGSPQYSDAFVSWIVSEAANDPLFFDSAKRSCKGLKQGEMPAKQPSQMDLSMNDEKITATSA